MPKKQKIVRYPAPRPEQINPLDGLTLREDAPPNQEPATRNPQSSSPHLIFSSPTVWLYHDNCLSVLDAIAEKYPEGRFDCIFADPPYFLSNGGITCHAGKMVRSTRAIGTNPAARNGNHEFNREWLERCQRVLKPNGTIWVTGTHHVIFSVGFAMQQLGFKNSQRHRLGKAQPAAQSELPLLHPLAPKPILWAAKNEKSKHLFNYACDAAVTGKQMKTVWRATEFSFSNDKTADIDSPSPKREDDQSSIWTMTAPGRDEKNLGKHPAQKPVSLVERCILASTNEGELILDPFLGAGTTAVAAINLKRRFVGIELDEEHIQLAAKRAKSALEKNAQFYPPPPPPPRKT